MMKPEEKYEMIKQQAIMEATYKAWKTVILNIDKVITAIRLNVDCFIAYRGSDKSFAVKLETDADLVNEEYEPIDSLYYEDELPQDAREISTTNLRRFFEEYYALSDTILKLSDQIEQSQIWTDFMPADIDKAIKEYDENE